MFISDKILLFSLSALTLSVHICPSHAMDDWTMDGRNMLERWATPPIASAAPTRPAVEAESPLYDGVPLQLQSVREERKEGETPGSEYDCEAARGGVGGRVSPHAAAPAPANREENEGIFVTAISYLKSAANFVIKRGVAERARDAFEKAVAEADKAEEVYIKLGKEAGDYDAKRVETLRREREKSNARQAP